MKLINQVRLLAVVLVGMWVVALTAVALGAEAVGELLAAQGKLFFLAGLVLVLVVRGAGSRSDRASWWCFAAAVLSYLGGAAAYATVGSPALWVGVIAAVVLAGILVGLPALLLALGGNPLPETPPSLDQVRDALLTPDDGTLALTGAKLLGWVVWAALSLSIVVEAVSALRGVRGLALRRGARTHTSYRSSNRCTRAARCGGGPKMWPHGVYSRFAKDRLVRRAGWPAIRQVGVLTRISCACSRSLRAELWRHAAPALAAAGEARPVCLS